MNLTDMQKRYIWLAGSYPQRNLVQGRGKRTRKLLYALHGEDEIVVFGYSNPPEWLVHRKLFRPLQARNNYTLTEEGEAIFQKLHATNAGLKLNEQIELTKVRE